MNKGKVTALPWVRRGTNIFGNKIGSELVCSTGKLSDIHAERANADFIVKAANNHDALVGIIKMFLGNDLSERSVRGVICAKARTVLNETEGK